MGEAKYIYFTCLKFVCVVVERTVINMAAPAKRRNVEEDPNEVPSSDDDEEIDSDEEFEDGDDDGEEEDEAMGVEMNVNFDAQTATDSDFHGIKRLLQQLFLKANVNLSALTDVILGQNHVGSVIKQAPLDEDEEDEDEMESDAVDEVFGISTVINLTHRLTNEAKNAPSEGDKAINQLVNLLVDKSDKNGGPVQTKTLQAFLTDKEKHTGWLLNERFVNIPAQISLPLYDSLRDEMHSACAKGQKFKFDYFLLLSKALKEKGAKKKDQDELIFTNGEEELFQEECAFSFAFSVADQQADAETIPEGGNDDDASYEPWRVVMIIPAEKMEVVAKKMTDILGASIEGKVSSLR